jgi:hypothetical protein
MAAIITEKFRRHNAIQFHESFSEASATTYYLFIGKSSPFTSTTSGGDDNVPPVPADDINSESVNWRSMLGAKLISASDISFVIPRRDWTNNTLYDMYEHDISTSNPASSGATNLWDATFYFMTSEYRVYKVLDNNNGAVYSGAEPATEVTTPFELGGYTMQYMYKLTTTQIQKFLTSDFLPVTTDSAVSSAAVDGGLDILRVTGGSGYTDGTYYAPIDGDGSNGIAKIVVSGGAIAAQGASGSNIYQEGSGYTFATIDLTDLYSDTALTSSASIGAGTGGAVQLIISPRGGNGYDAVYELGGHYVMMNTKLEQNEGDDITIANDFRTVGIVKDPFNFGTSTVASASTRRQTYAIKFASAPTFSYEIDEEIEQSTTGAIGRVVEWDADNNILYYLQEEWDNYGVDANGNLIAFSGANAITGQSSNAVGTPSTTVSETVVLTGGTNLIFTSGYANPELQPNTGDIIYVENRRPISRASDQTEDIKIVVEF